MKILVLATAALILCGGTAGVAYWLLYHEEAAGPLKAETQFPEGFFQFNVAKQASALSGSSYCPSIWGGIKLLAGGRDDRTTDGIYMSPGLSPENILASNPLANPAFRYDRVSKTELIVDHQSLPNQRPTLLCDYQYYLTVGRVQAAISNHDETVMPDSAGAPYTYAKTPVTLDGSRVIENTTRFAAVISYSGPEHLVLSYLVFPKGKDTPGNLIASETVEGEVANDSVTFVIQVPTGPTTPTKADIFLIPVLDTDLGPRAPPLGAVAFPLFGKLAGESAFEVRSTAAVPLPEEPWNSSQTSNEITVLRAETNSGIARFAAVQSTSDENTLDAAGHGSYILERVIAADESPKARHKPAVPPAGSRAYTASSTAETVTSEGTSVVTVRFAPYDAGERHWLLTSATRTWLRDAATSPRTALQATTTVTEVSASGVRVVEKTVTGEAAEATIEAARASLMAKSNTAEMSATARGEDKALSAKGQRFFLAATALDVAWQLTKASTAEDEISRLAYENAASKAAVMGIGALNPQVALGEAIWSISAWAGEKVGGPAVGTLFTKTEDLVISALFGQASAADAAEALENLRGDISGYVQSYEAPLVQQAPRAVPGISTSETMLVLVGALAVGVIGRWTRFRRT